MNNKEFRKSMKENIKQGKNEKSKGVFKYDGVDKLLYENLESFFEEYTL